MVTLVNDYHFTSMKNLPLFALLTFIIFSCNSENNEINQAMLYSSAQMDEANLSQYDAGTNRYSDIRAEYKTTPNNSENENKRLKIGILLQCANDVETETDEIIRKIENLKIEFLKRAGVLIDQLENKDANTLFWRKYDTINKSLPSSLNLASLKTPELSYDLSDVLVSDVPTSVTKVGKDLWNSLQKFRLNIVNIVGTCSTEDKSKSLKLKAINEFDSYKSLHDQVDQMISASGANINNDRYILIDIYSSLTKPEYEMVNGKKTHWINKQFQNATLLSALLTLNSLENEILGARTAALSHISSKVNICGYGFDEILVLTNGPSLAFEGEEVVLQVSIGAFDSYNDPVVNVNEITSKIEYKNGLGIVRFKAKKGIQTINGTVSIRNKSGVMTTKTWEWKVNVLKKDK